MFSISTLRKYIVDWWNWSERFLLTVEAAFPEEIKFTFFRIEKFPLNAKTNLTLNIPH